MHGAWLTRAHETDDASAGIAARSLLVGCLCSARTDPYLAKAAQLPAASARALLSHRSSSAAPRTYVRRARAVNWTPTHHRSSRLLARSACSKVICFVHVVVVPAAKPYHKPTLCMHAFPTFRSSIRVV